MFVGSRSLLRSHALSLSFSLPLAVGALVACDAPPVEPVEHVAAPLDVVRACLGRLPADLTRDDADARGAVDLGALFTVELAPGQAPGVTRLAAFDEEAPLVLNDEGVDGDARPGDRRFSARVSAPRSLDEAREVCGDGAELDLGLEAASPAVATVALESGGAGQRFRNCPYRPLDYYECTECGGTWAPYYYCDYWWGCYQIGYRCYGW